MAAITLKTESQIAKMREAGRLTYLTLKLMGELVRPGITTKELDKAAYEFIRDNGAKPSFLDYNGYPASICASVNEQVVHGIPGEYELKDGDIVSIDVGAYLNGWHGDAARTFIVGETSPAVKKLVEVTKECFFEGLKMCVAGNELSAVSAAIQNHAERAGYGVVRELVGHGIGRRMHEEPEVPNFTDPHFPRVRLHAGMTIAIEPMINMGRADVRMLRDGWTVIAADRKPSAHYENTVAITEAGRVNTYGGVNIMTEKHLTVGSVAMSAAGRDSGRAFVVLGEADNDYVLIADGKLRKLEKPKKKKRRHLKDTGVRADDIINALNEGRLLDADVRKRLAQLGFGRDISEEGGQDV